MIYCVVPQSLEPELYERLAEYYRDDPNVEVIVDRRGGPDRRRSPDRERTPDAIRDRRRRRARGTFPAIEAEAEA